MIDSMLVSAVHPGSARAGCIHRWLIETPNGATSPGVCRYCGARRRFPNAWEGWHLREAIELDFVERFDGRRGVPIEGDAA